MQAGISCSGDGFISFFSVPEEPHPHEKLSDFDMPLKTAERQRFELKNKAADP
jgi:hypothetical protein